MYIHCTCTCIYARVLTHVLQHFVPLGLHAADLLLQKSHLLLVLLLHDQQVLLSLLQLLHQLLLHVDLWGGREGGRGGGRGGGREGGREGGRGGGRGKKEMWRRERRKEEVRGGVGEMINNGDTINKARQHNNAT